ncbi:MAG TPA: GNAT family N-acetyltransferase [Pseudolabrys sp.]|nr:GNAT family N-acetyltransferase [Pseudolabrys sp.]
MSPAARPAFQLPAALVCAGHSLRRADDGDLPFQRMLFERARPDLAVLAAWPEAVRAPFLDQQFHFQTAHYARVYPQAERLILLAGEDAIGRLILDCAAERWCLVDIALLPAWRGRGIGEALLRAIQTQAVQAGAGAVELMVESINPARRLYERLGFAAVADEPPHVAMTWSAPIAQLKIA